MTEDITKELEEFGITEDDLNDYDSAKAAAEKVEALNKAKEEEEVTPEVKEEVTTDPKLEGQIARLAKAIAKNKGVKAEATETTEQPATLTRDDVKNLQYLAQKGLTEESPEAQKLQEYAQLPSNEGKSFKEIADTLEYKAFSAQIEAEREASNIIDENSDEDFVFKTKNDIYSRYKETGEDPTTDYEAKVVADKELEEFGFKKVV